MHTHVLCFKNEWSYTWYWMGMHNRKIRNKKVSKKVKLWILKPLVMQCKPTTIGCCLKNLTMKDYIKYKNMHLNGKL